MKRLWSAWALAALIGAGCATVESRIRKHPELFEALPPEVQQAVRQGRVEVGFPADAVYLALGAPQRKYTRQTADGVSEVWSYVDYTYTPDRQRVEGRFRVRDSRGVTRTVYDSVWVDVNVRHEYERLRVELRDGRVVAVEQIQR